MKLHELSPAEGSSEKKFRKGRGAGSGNGKTAGKGHKGQNARSGGGVRPGFEGGQNPLYRRLPKRGFKNHFAVRYAIVNVKDLERYNDGDEIDIGVLLKDRVIRKAYDGLKVLGDGEISKKITVKAAVFSETAEKKLIAAGGKAEVI